jgi:hypothetical protein
MSSLWGCAFQLQSHLVDQDLQVGVLVEHLHHVLLLDDLHLVGGVVAGILAGNWGYSVMIVPRAGRTSLRPPSGYSSITRSSRGSYASRQTSVRPPPTVQSSRGSRTSRGTSLRPPPGNQAQASCFKLQASCFLFHFN